MSESKQVSIDDDCIPHCGHSLLTVQIPRSVKKPFILSQTISSQFTVRSTVAVANKHKASTPTAVTVAESFVCLLVCCEFEHNVLLSVSCRRVHNVLVVTGSPQMLTAQSTVTWLEQEVHRCWLHSPQWPGLNRKSTDADRTVHNILVGAGSPQVLTAQFIMCWLEQEVHRCWQHRP